MTIITVVIILFCQYYYKIGRRNSICVYRIFDNENVCPKRFLNCALMKRRFCDSASSYWLVSLQRASPLGRPSVQLPRLLSSVDLLSSCVEDQHTHTHVRHAFYAAVKRKRRCVHLRVCCRAWFLRSGWVLEGRSQLLILRCTEKAPCTEVRDRLRNRNDGVFYLQTSHRYYICHVFPLSGLSRVCESGGKSGYVGCYPCHSL